MRLYQFCAYRIVILVEYMGNVIMKTEKLVSLESISHLRTEAPKHAYFYLKQYFTRENISCNEAAKSLGVHKSTVARLLKGGSLTVSMASKLYKAYKLSPEMLFLLEAKANTYAALNFDCVA